VFKNSPTPLPEAAWTWLVPARYQGQLAAEESMKANASVKSSSARQQARLAVRKYLAPNQILKL